jgi:hypothetical protein
MVVLAAVMFCAVALVALIVSVTGGRSNDAGGSGERMAGGRLALAGLDTSAGSDRPIFRHSVVPGGVYTADELRNVLVQDAIAATHYQGLNPNAVRVETVKQERFAYVSYRKNDQIYWTRNKVRLSEGETILTDGANEIRARCGNCISETPQLPVAEIEPASVEFDQLVDDPGDPFLSASIRSALDSPAFGASAGSGRPGAGGGPAAGASSAGVSSTDPGGSGLIPSGSAGGGGGLGPASLASGDPSLGGQPGAPGFQSEVVRSAPGGPTTDDPASPASDSPSALGSTAGAAPGPSSTGTPGNQSHDLPSGPLVANVPGGPSAPGTSSPDGPPFGASFPESRLVPSGTAASIPPGIDPPPGFDPAIGLQPSASKAAPPTLGPKDGRRNDPAGASLPEPGMLILLGGGAAAVLLRQIRRRR